MKDSLAFEVQNTLPGTTPCVLRLTVTLLLLHRSSKFQVYCIVSYDKRRVIKKKNDTGNIQTYYDYYIPTVLYHDLLGNNVTVHACEGP